MKRDDQAGVLPTSVATASIGEPASDGASHDLARTGAVGRGV